MAISCQLQASSRDLQPTTVTNHGLKQLVA
jgi:hypothetical protein